MSVATLLLCAMLIEIIFGWPPRLYRLIRHPVVWIGALIDCLERVLNRGTLTQVARRLSGAVVVLLVVGVSTIPAIYLMRWFPNQGWGLVAQALIASSLLATRSLYEHVAAVRTAMLSRDFDSARIAVGRIVGRDPSCLDDTGICRASIESLAENASDGVIAPLFWGALFGLPGMAAYKAINTLDSMLGHRTERFEAFGAPSARLDDIANWIPARLTALLFIAAGLSVRAVVVSMRDAGSHRSPNGGWPESAMAGVVNVRLSGPRIYGAETSNEPWINEGCPDPKVSDLSAALRTYVVAMSLVVGGLVLVCSIGEYR